MPQKRERQSAPTPRTASSAGRTAARHGSRSASARGGVPGSSGRLKHAAPRRTGSHAPSASARRGTGTRTSSTSGTTRQRTSRASQAEIHSVKSVTPRATGPAGVEVNLPGKGEILLTRRHFLYGVAGVAAIAALAGGGYAATKIAGSSSDDVTTLSVPTDAVLSSEDCTQIEDATTVMSLTSSQELPYGSLVWANDDDVAVCLLPTEEAKPLTQIGLISLGAGTYTTALGNAVGEAEGFDIYDVRSCADGLVWTEANILDGTWRIYHATLNGLEMGTPTLADEGDSEWEMPTLAAAAGHAFWQTLPQLDGAARLEDSTLKRAAFGSSTVETVYASHGRMACAPCSTREGVVIAPRANTDGTYYQLTYINAQSGEVEDALTLPTSMKPFELGYGKSGFCFCFESIYNYGDGIANLGTYTPSQDMGDAIAQSEAAASAEAEAAASSSSGSGSSSESQASLTLAAQNEQTAARHARHAADAYGNAAWFRFARTPSTSPAWCGDWFMVKSTSNVCGVDLSSGAYFSLDTESGVDDYGDFLASSGSGQRVVTYSNIDYTPLSGDQVKHCLVRVWEAV